MLQTRPQGLAAGPDLPHSLLDVPDNVLQNILQRLDLQQRLSPVCTRWRQVAPPSFIEVSGLNDDKLSSLLEYLDSHGDNVSSMRLHGAWDKNWDDVVELIDWPLPCSNLRDLELHTFRLQRSVVPSEGVLSAFTGLTRLVIDIALFTAGWGTEPDSVVAPGSAEEKAAAAAAEAEADASFAAIQHLTSLQELQLKHISAVVQLPSEFPKVCIVYSRTLDLPGERLAALTQLTKLLLTAATTNPRGTLQHISRLQHLQDLKLAHLPPTGPEDDEPPQVDDPAAVDTFAGLGALQHLTSLSVSWVPGMLTRHYLQGPGEQSHSSEFTALQRLQLDWVMFEAALLAGMKQLTCLELSDITWVLESQDAPPGPGAGQAPPAHGLPAYQLLLLLPHLKQLRRLRLDVETWPEAEYQLPAYSALTANTNLEHLDLQHLHLQQYQYPLPTTAWKHIFRKELQLPGIAAVKIQGSAPQTSEGRVLDCCPVAAAGMREGRVSDGLLELRGLDEDEGVSPAELRLLEVNADDPPGVPAVLGALTHLEVVFSGVYHGWGVHGCSEAEFQEGDFGMQQNRGGIIR